MTQRLIVALSQAEDQLIRTQLGLPAERPR
jgi:hypothetical protein